VKSSIGAGDSTVAGFVAQYLTTGDLHSSFLFANACGVSTALHAGSQVCTKEDVKTQMQRIICTHIEKGEFV
jgi:1-phosphofructokinase